MWFAVALVLFALVCVWLGWVRGFVVGLLVCVVLTGVLVLVICGFCGVGSSC